MKLDDDDFILFGLPQRFAQDGAEIAERWKALAAKVHPDRFAADGAASQRLAMQWALRVNEAHQRLRDPLKRASYLCELRGAPIQANENTRMPAAFLMEQMEWRESLDEAKTPTRSWPSTSRSRTANGHCWRRPAASSMTRTTPPAPPNRCAR